MKLKYLIPLALAIWWLPILSGLILGFVTSFLEREHKKGVLTIILSSLIASAFYISLAIYVLKVPFLGNLLPTFSVIFSIIDTVIATLTFNFIFYKSSYSTITTDGMYTEFYVSSREEIEDRLKDLLVNCRDPQLTLSEDKISVHRECSGYIVDYEMIEAGKNKYKVRLQVKKKED
ncbi:hypothetical protein [Sulfurisphaera javensis]|uniref:hypothetical protein n=1 Tax=Sulfurisphaera javensis TaxID=2049879 RepID=UPI0034E8CAEA